jgi:hypothetical protein
MTDGELRDRIVRADPAARAATDPITSPEARALLEEIMNTPVLDSQPTPDEITDRRRRRWTVPALVAAAAVAAVGLGVVLAGTGDEDGGELADAPIVTTAPGKLKVLELSTGTENVMAMCMPITPELIAEMPVAFKGTVDSSEGAIVTLTIDQAYRGTDAQVVTLVAPEGLEALIGGVAFVPGQQYLITATDGVVNYCGFSGPATPELQALFDQAFPT